MTATGEGALPRELTESGLERPPVKGKNLALRLYLLLVASLLPIFGVAYFAGGRVADDLRAKAVDDVVRTNRLRIEDRLAAHGSLTPSEMTPAERAELERELERIVGERSGVDGVAVFSADERGALRFVAAGGGPAVEREPSAEDARAFAEGALQKVDAGAGYGQSAQAFSVPLRQRDRLRGTIHLTVLPARVGLPIPDLRTSLLLGMAAVLVTIGFGVAVFFHLAVRRPVRDLAEAMGAAAGGDLDALVQMRSGELGGLGLAYNRMMRRLKAAHDESRRIIEKVRGGSDDQRRQADAATAELAARNAELKAARESLSLIQRQFATLEKLATLGEVATTVAHELGTPLNAISGHLQLLLKEPGLGPAATDRMHIIDAQVDRLGGIIRNVLDTMRVPPPRFAPIDVNQVIEDALGLISPVAEKRGVRLARHLAPDVPEVRADADQLTQVFMNLFTNAMDAMAKGGALAVESAVVAAEDAARLGRELSVGLAGNGAFLKVDVRDTGVGMDEHEVRQAFRPFFTTKGSATRDGMGVGLGLSLCQKIVKGHRGEIAVQSRKGSGTCFTIFLPVVEGV